MVIEAFASEALAAKIKSRFGAEAKLIDNKLRLERAAGHRFTTEIVEAFPGEIESISISKPTLEDVFIRRTGHRFWIERMDVETKKKH